MKAGMFLATLATLTLVVACSSSGGGGAGGTSGAGASGASGTAGSSGSGGTTGGSAGAGGASTGGIAGAGALGGGGGEPACTNMDSNGFFSDCTSCLDPGNCDTIDTGGAVRYACGCGVSGCPCGLSCGCYELAPGVTTCDICVR